MMQNYKIQKLVLVFAYLIIILLQSCGTECGNPVCSSPFGGSSGPDLVTEHPFKINNSECNLQQSFRDSAFGYQLRLPLTWNSTSASLTAVELNSLDETTLTITPNDSPVNASASLENMLTMLEPNEETTAFLTNSGELAYFFTTESAEDIEAHTLYFKDNATIVKMDIVRNTEQSILDESNCVINSFTFTP